MLRVCVVPYIVASRMQTWTYTLSLLLACIPCRDPQLSSGAKSSQPWVHITTTEMANTGHQMKLKTEIPGYHWGRDHGTLSCVGHTEHLPVALPGMAHIGIVDLVLVCLLIQEVKHVLDGQWQG